MRLSAYQKCVLSDVAYIVGVGTAMAACLLVPAFVLISIAR